MGRKLRDRARERRRVNAMMGQEAFVLIREKQVEEARVNVFRPHRKPPASLRRRVGTQELAVPVEHLRRESEPLPDGRRTKRDDPHRGGGANHKEQSRDHRQ